MIWVICMECGATYRVRITKSLDAALKCRKCGGYDVEVA